MPDSTQDDRFFSDRMPADLKDLIIKPFESDVATLGRLSRVNAHTRVFIQPRLEKLLLANSLVFGASALRGYRDDLIDELLGIPGSWQSKDEAMLVVARTFSAFRPGARAPAYPLNWRELAPFRKVHDWWCWACDTDVHLALRVDLLAFLLLAGELFLADLNGLERYWSYGRFNWESDELKGSNFKGGWYGMFSHKYTVHNRRNSYSRSYKFECETHEYRGDHRHYPKKNMEPTVMLVRDMSNSDFSLTQTTVSVPTKSTINDWALNIMAELARDPNLYRALALPPGIETTGAVVKSLHAGPKTMFTRDLPKVDLKNCDILL